MNILISSTNAFAKWLKLDLPRIPSPDGKKIGVQSLESNRRTVSWQCHLIKNLGKRGSYCREGPYTVIAVEAYSRYTLLIPFEAPPTQTEFELTFEWRLGEEIIPLMIESGAITEMDIEAVLQQYKQTERTYSWFKNTDLSVNGHVSDAEAWVRQTLEEYDLIEMDDAECISLGMHINKMFKRSGSPKQKFYPVARMVDDAIYRFARGLSEFNYPDTPGGDFPCPYVDDEQILPRRIKPTNNVVSLADYKKRSE
jgi:hypothetical protein